MSDTAGSSSDRDYATQTEAPTPDYKALLAKPSLSDGGWKRREATTAPPSDAKKIGRLWVQRLESRNAITGYGLGGKGPDGPVSMIDTAMTEQAFENWAAENGWQVPTHITWSFVPEMHLPRVSDKAAEGIRVWPASTARTGAQNEALLWGRVELRDGCFYGDTGDGTPQKLAFFHEEIGLDVDDEGYYILRDRVSGRTLARIGEQMNWGGPPTAYIAPELEAEIQEKCGPGEILVVGSPESEERFKTQYPHLREPVAPPPPPGD
ncbi:hypothetical protein [Qipengyuania sphaerica]|uniref:hypothetical protein n=1 Tax=Qipengyuania sphaerica TaxID=2867243 RepID=UPI001C874E65|nr:hypothetical protein [Qipengyuania sphaerica]MBX7540263.1 hypothetical protein [Qipengyuania sphaerica]